MQTSVSGGMVVKAKRDKEETLGHMGSRTGFVCGWERCEHA